MRTHILIQRGEQPSAPGPAECFTGTVRIEHLFSAHVPARASGSSVEFRPGARTAWHSHPLGQTLIVTSGKGLVQEWNGPVQEVLPGDVVWFPPDVKHWAWGRQQQPHDAYFHLRGVGRKKRLLDGKGQ